MVLKPASYKGLFIVLEGMDGSGKSTQIQRVGQALSQQGISLYLTAEPSRGPYGQKLRERRSQRLSPDEEFSLYLEDRRWHLKEEVLPALERGEWVLQDRYYYSNIAYQSGERYSAEHIRQKNEEFALVPDLVFYLDLEPAEALRRIHKRGEPFSVYEKSDFLTKVRQSYLEQPGLQRIDACQSPEKISQLLLEHIFDRAARKEKEQKKSAS